MLTTTIADLPLDVLKNEIFSRVPMLQFKGPEAYGLVSKEWLKHEKEVSSQQFTRPEEIVQNCIDDLDCALYALTTPTVYQNFSNDDFMKIIVSHPQLLRKCLSEQVIPFSALDLLMRIKNPLCVKEILSYPKFEIDDGQAKEFVKALQPFPEIVREVLADSKNSHLSLKTRRYLRQDVSITDMFDENGHVFDEYRFHPKYWLEHLELFKKYPISADLRRLYGEGLTELQLKLLTIQDLPQRSKYDLYFLLTEDAAIALFTDLALADILPERYSWQIMALHRKPRLAQALLEAYGNQMDNYRLKALGMNGNIKTAMQVLATPFVERLDQDDIVRIIANHQELDASFLTLLNLDKLSIDKLSLLRHNLAAAWVIYTSSLLWDKLPLEIKLDFAALNPTIAHDLMQKPDFVETVDANQLLRLSCRYIDVFNKLIANQYKSQAEKINMEISSCFDLYTIYPETSLHFFASNISKRTFPAYAKYLQDKSDTTAYKQNAYDVDNQKHNIEMMERMCEVASKLRKELKGDKLFLGI